MAVLSYYKHTSRSKNICITGFLGPGKCVFYIQFTIKCIKSYCLMVKDYLNYGLYIKCKEKHYNFKLLIASKVHVIFLCAQGRNKNKIEIL